MSKIIDILKTDQPTLSFEVFPPKTESSYKDVEAAAREIAALHPSFMSVTYGAGGGTRRYTAEIANDLQNTFHVPTLAHLTCVSSTKETVDSVIANMKANQLENVLALRGDLPAEETPAMAETLPFAHASDLTSYIRSNSDFCIGGACYPEGHPEATNKSADIVNIKKKVDAGCDFLTTQMFFDNSIMFNYMYRLREAGVMVPVCAGIMPVTNGKQLERIVKLSGSVLPARFLALVDRFGSDQQAMTQAGIAYATDQIIDLLANGINHIHVYSMNKPEVARGICENLSHIIPLN